MKIDIKKVRETAKFPSRTNPSDAGADVFYDGDTIFLFPGESKLCGTGLRIATPLGWVCEVKNRSGMAAKKSLVVGSCIVDCGYSGELFIDIHNIGTKLQTVENGDKIAQIIFYQVGLPEFNLLNEEEGLYNNTPTASNRGEKGFGSSGM